MPACFTPSPPTGVPCSSDVDCPSPQVCDTVSHTCEVSCDDCPPIDATPTGCWDRWLSRTVTFEPPRKLVELQNGTGDFANPSVSFDELAIYFEHRGDPWGASRLSSGDPFGMPELVSELQTSMRDSRISTTMDDRVAVFASDRTGTLGALDLWQATRGPDGVFGAPSSSLFASINTAGNEFDPELTPDGLDLYWAPDTAGLQQIHHASRTTIDAAFDHDAVVAVTAPGQNAYYDPGISPDQRVLVFAADDGSSNADSRLFYATRATPADDFGLALELVELDTTSHDGDADLAADGCTLYFSSNRDGNTAIYAAAVQP